LNHGYGSAFENNDSVEIVQRRLELDIDARGPSGKRHDEGRVESSDDADSLPHDADPDPRAVRRLSGQQRPDAPRRRPGGAAVRRTGDTRSPMRADGR